MTEDLSHVPRRLRRFYRHGQPVPEELMHINEPKESTPSAQGNPKSLFSNPFAKSAPANQRPMGEERDEDFREPWMDAQSSSMPGRKMPSSPSPTSPNSSTPLSRREQRRTQVPMSAASPSSNASAPPQGLFARVMGSAAPKPKPMDQALGLQKKQMFEDRLPSASEKIIQGNPPSGPSSNANPELQSTLNELKRLAGTPAGENESKENNPSLTSFHFTPVAEAPRPVDPTSPGSSQPLLSPKQRVEMRRMREGSTAFGAAGGEDRERPAETAAPSSSVAPANTSPANTPAHIRRRMGQVMSGSASESEEPMGEESPEKEERAPANEEEDFKDLLGGGSSAKKKKAKPKDDDDEDFSLDGDLDEDISPLDEK